jgi:hypothetical protein
MQTQIVFLIIGTILTSVLYLFLSYIIDFFIATKVMGDLHTHSSSWTSFGNLRWTFSSILGPAMSINKWGFFVIGAASGLFFTMYLRNVVFGVRPYAGSHYWLLCAIIITWILRYPVPLKYSLYYFSCVRY